MARRLRSVRSHAAEDEASSSDEETSPPQMQQAPPTPCQLAPLVFAILVFQSALVVESQAEVVAQLLPALMSIQQVLQ